MLDVRQVDLLLVVFRLGSHDVGRELCSRWKWGESRTEAGVDGNVERNEMCRCFLLSMILQRTERERWFLNVRSREDGDMEERRLKAAKARGVQRDQFPQRSGTPT